MILSDMVESLLNSLGGGPVEESKIKGPLTHIHEQAKAQETEIERKQAEIEHAEKRITALELI